MRTNSISMKGHCIRYYLGYEGQLSQFRPRTLEADLNVEPSYCQLKNQAGDTVELKVTFYGYYLPDCFPTSPVSVLHVHFF